MPHRWIKASRDTTGQLTMVPPTREELDAGVVYRGAELRTFMVDDVLYVRATAKGSLKGGCLWERKLDRDIDDICVEATGVFLEFGRRVPLNAYTAIEPFGAAPWLIHTIRDLPSYAQALTSFEQEFAP